MLLRQLGRELRRLDRAARRARRRPAARGGGGRASARALLLPTRLARPVERVASVLAAGREALRRTGGSAEDVLWAIWSASGLAAGLGSAKRGRRRRRAPRPIVTSTRCSSCSARRPGSPTGCRRPRRASSSTSWPGSRCRATASADGRRWRADPHRARQQGSRVGSRLRGRRAGRQLAQPAAARIAARVGAAGRRARRPGGRRSERAERHRAERDRTRPGRGTPAVLRRGHPGPAPAGRHRGQRSGRAAVAIPRRARSARARSRAADQPPVRQHPPARAGRRTARRGHRPDARRHRCEPMPRPSWPGWPRPASRARIPTTGGGWRAVRPRPGGRSRPAGADQPVRHPESFLDCELRALLGDLGARDGVQIAPGARHPRARDRGAAAPDADLPTLEAMLDERWATLDFGAGWYARNERVRARRFLTRLVRLAAREPGRTRTGRDRSSRSGSRSAMPRLGGSGRPARARPIRGAGDRRPQDRAQQGARRTSCPTHPQLGAYQLAVEHGAFADQGHGRRRGPAGSARRHGQADRAGAGAARPRPTTPTGSTRRSTTSPRGCAGRSSRRRQRALRQLRRRRVLPAGPDRPAGRPSELHRDPTVTSADRQ